MAPTKTVNTEPSSVEAPAVNPSNSIELPGFLQELSDWLPRQTASFRMLINIHAYIRGGTNPKTVTTGPAHTICLRDRLLKGDEFNFLAPPPVDFVAHCLSLITAANETAAETARQANSGSLPSSFVYPYPATSSRADPAATTADLAAPSGAIES